MRNKLLFFVCTFIPTILTAQESEPGGMWTAINIEKNITKQWSTGVELEYRTKGFSMERDRFAAQLGTDYELIKNLKIGASYSWLNVDDDYKFSDDSIRTDYFQNRHRFNLQATWKFKVGDFSFQFRERAQGTFKDDSDRLKSNGKVNANRINPEYVWRNRLKVSYGKKKMPWSPYISIETYYLLNEPESIRFYNSAATNYTEKSSYFTKLRYTLGLEYKINKQHAVEVYGMYSHERGAEEIEVIRPTFDNQGMFTGLENDQYHGLTNWTRDYIVGVGYTYSF